MVPRHTSGTRELSPTLSPCSSLRGTLESPAQSGKAGELSTFLPPSQTLDPPSHSVVLPHPGAQILVCPHRWQVGVVLRVLPPALLLRLFAQEKLRPGLDPAFWRGHQRAPVEVALDAGTWRSQNRGSICRNPWELRQVMSPLDACWGWAQFELGGCIPLPQMILSLRPPDAASFTPAVKP